MHILHQFENASSHYSSLIVRCVYNMRLFRDNWNVTLHRIYILDSRKILKE